MELTASGFATVSGVGTLTVSADVIPAAFFAGMGDCVAGADEFNGRLGTHEGGGKSPLAFFNRLPSIVVNGLIGKLIVNQAYPWLTKAWDAASPHLHHVLALIISRWSDH